MIPRFGIGKLACGRGPDPGRRRRVEECEGRLTVRGWFGGDRPPGLEVDLVETRPNFGGVRHWFSCPGCGRRCGVLYRPTPGDDWGCRRCHGLAYRSAQLAHRDESIHAALATIGRYMATAPGDWEGLFEGKSHAETIAICRAVLYLDVAGDEAIADALIRLALAGELRAIKTCFDLVEGKPRMAPRNPDAVPVADLLD